MGSLSTGEWVLDSPHSASRVIAVQHKAAESLADLVHISTAAGRTLSMSANHAIFSNDALVAVSDVVVGDRLTTADGSHDIVLSTSKLTAAVVNVVTLSGTILANDLLAASNPLATAKHTIGQPCKRALVNLVIYAVGDADSLYEGLAKLLGWMAAMLAVALGLVRAAAKRDQKMKPM